MSGEFHGEHGVQALCVAWQLGGEQRDGDGAGLDGSEKADDVLDTLRGQDRHPVTGLGDLTQAVAYGIQPGPELRPCQLYNAVMVEIQVPVSGCVAEFHSIAAEE